MAETTKEVNVKSVDRLQKVLGTFDENANIIMHELGVSLHVDGLKVVLYGGEESISSAVDVIECLSELAAEGEPIDKNRISYCIELAKEGRAKDILKLSGSTVGVTHRGKPIKCKTVGQKRYADCIRHDTVVFGVGPAGTGKTYLAVCLAVQTKVDPYLRPLYDALQEMLGLETYTKLMERGSIEIAPLAYMRGRTLSNAFVILDEAQNTTREQMKMFLTRMGDGSKMVITGDLTQIDLPEGKKSGLAHAIHVLRDIDGIAICHLTDKDVVRHPLVMKIVRAYETESKRSEGEKGEK